MTDPAEFATVGSVAGLARQIEAIHRDLAGLRELPGRVEDLARLIAHAAESAASANAVPVSARSWLALPRGERTAAELLDDLISWVRQIYQRYPDGAARLPECWLWHPDLVEELLWLMCAWHAAYQVDGAPVSLAGDWHDRYRPGVVRRIEAIAGRCSPEVHHQPPAPPRTPSAQAIAQIAAWWGEHRDQPAPAPDTAGAGIPSRLNRRRP